MTIETSDATAVNENQTSLIIAAQQAGAGVPEAVAPTVVYAPTPEQNATGLLITIALAQSSFAGCAKLAIDRNVKIPMRRIRVNVRCFIFYDNS
jgi:hypothetical protein